jgi:hypothetical protein
MLNPEVAAFLEDGQDIRVAICTARLGPVGYRAVAAVVDPGRTHVTAFVPEASAAALLENLEGNRQVAMSFGRPSDDRTYQVKGRLIASRPATADERAVIEGQLMGLGQQMAMLAIPIEHFAGWPHWPAVAFKVEVTAVFNQTPGPGAGAPLP